MRFISLSCAWGFISNIPGMFAKSDTNNNYVYTALMVYVTSEVI